MSSGAGATETHVASACPLDCPDACSLDVTVEGDRVVRSAGAASIRHRRLHLLEGPAVSRARARRPGRLPSRSATARKGGGGFRRASWDEALELVAARFRGPLGAGRGEAILPLSYGGSNGYLSQDTTDARLFRRLGASRLARTVCAAPTARAAMALYGKMAGIAIRTTRTRGSSSSGESIRPFPGSIWCPTPGGAAPRRPARRRRSAPHAARRAGRPAPGCPAGRRPRRSHSP